MAYVEMIIDSIRLAKYRDEWLILLREKDGCRYLPVGPSCLSERYRVDLYVSAPLSYDVAAGPILRQS